MFEKYADYTITLPGYKMEILLAFVERAGQEKGLDPYTILQQQNLVNEIENAKKKEYAE